MTASSKLFPCFVVSLGILWLAMTAYAPADPDDGYHLQKFAALPVQEGGRIMSFDKFARTKLMQLSHRQSTTIDTPKADREGVVSRPMSATEWVLEMIALPYKKDPAVLGAHVFRIDNDELLNFLGLKKTPEHGFLFKMDDFATAKFKNELNKLIKNKGPAKDDLFENKFYELAQKYDAVYNLAGGAVPHLAPPAIRNAPGDDIADRDWLSLSAMFEEMDAGNNNGIFKHIEQIIVAYGKGPAAFNRALDAYIDDLNREHSDILAKNRLEVFFDHFAPYYQCTVLFVSALILAVLSWIVWTKPLRQSAFALGILTMVVYTWTLYVRVQLSGYAPVTSLYSSAIFIGWGCAGLCLLLELILKNGIGTAVAAVTGSMALIVAHNLLDGDSMGKVVAVLESNFWLSTHVICITLGYTATFVAGFLGITYVMLGRFTDGLRGASGVLLGKIIYGIVCFAMLLSFVGTVLGGIWADQSWGRFWGWDPKENGALLIVIWNAIILHARWAGMAKTRGLALLAIFGNVVTAWSWFGTNLLGVGLHSYGFMKGAMIWLGVFAVSQLAIIAVGMTAQNKWLSFRRETPREVDGELAPASHGSFPRAVTMDQAVRQMK